MHYIHLRSLIHSWVHSSLYIERATNKHSYIRKIKKKIQGTTKTCRALSLARKFIVLKVILGILKSQALSNDEQISSLSLNWGSRGFIGFLLD